jgi:RHS repeat-associated protein
MEVDESGPFGRGLRWVGCHSPLRGSAVARLWRTGTPPSPPCPHPKPLVDVMNHLTNFNSGAVSMVYDGDGNRVTKKKSGTTTYYLVDDLNPSGYAQVLEELTVSGSVTKVYNYGMSLISQRAPNSSTNYFIYDGHGSTRMLTDAGGNFVNAFAYDAFGNLIASNSAPQTAYLYAGEQWDQDLGFYYLRNRMDNPNTGRFWTMDGKAGNQEDAKSLNRYSYGEGDPIDNADPSGNAVWLVTRPLSLTGLNLLAPLAVHVFLAFDDNLSGTIGGGDPLAKWESEVQQDNQNK